VSLKINAVAGKELGPGLVRGCFWK